MRYIPQTLLAIGGIVAASSIAPARAATADDPCTVSKTMVGAAMGLPVVRTSARTIGNLNSCSFHAARLFHYATISASREDSIDTAKSSYAHEITSASKMIGSPAIPEPGIGDEAAEIDGLIYVRKGTAIYNFTVIDGTPQPQPLPKALALARAVMPGVKP